MIHLKTLESFELPGDPKDYYSEITDRMFSNLGGRVNISPKIVKIIEKEGFRGDVNFYLKSKSKHYPYKEDKSRLEINQTLRISGEMPKGQENLALERFINIDVYELKDEWFKVSCSVAYRPRSYWNAPRDTTFYYKCDQIGGLLRLLKDLSVIK